VTHYHSSLLSLASLVLLLQSPIDKLDTPCLVRVLQYVTPQQQLVACGAVCSKWRKATREAISSINLYWSSQQKYGQLQQWFVYPPATLYELSLRGSRNARLRLQLSAAVLQHLKVLVLDKVRLEAVAVDGSMLQVEDLLPQLQHCTKLELCAWGDTELIAAAAAFQDMPALQDLAIRGEDAGLPKSLVVLPTTLTRLELFYDGDINATRAATISQLTRLRVLEVSSVAFDTSEEGRWWWWWWWGGGRKQVDGATFAACVRTCPSVGCPCHTPDAQGLFVCIGVLGSRLLVCLSARAIKEHPAVPCVLNSKNTGSLGTQCRPTQPSVIRRSTGRLRYVCGRSRRGFASPDKLGQRVRDHHSVCQCNSNSRVPPKALARVPSIRQ